MGKEYDTFVQEHIRNVNKAWQWIAHHFPDIREKIGMTDPFIDHDDSKWTICEYDAMSKYFYGDDISPLGLANYRKAKLWHHNANPHHWQYWVYNDEVTFSEPLDMPYHYIVEMICDWWSHSFKKHYLGEIFSWYELNKNHILLSRRTRDTVEEILDRIREELDKG